MTLLTEATVELFERRGLPLVPSPTHGLPPEGRHVLASIGFGGPDMKGALSILANETFWRSLASPDLPKNDHLLADMVGEFANMLLGRLRNSMLALGAEVATAIPSAVCGTNLVLDRTTSAAAEWSVFRSDRGPLFIRLQVAFRSDFTFGEATEWSVRPNEADLVLF
jgi:CheY-specific phosphatase CheX